MKQKLYTLTQAAERIGCHRSQTSRRAAELGIGTKIGHTTLVTEAEIKKLASVIRPRPRK